VGSAAERTGGSAGESAAIAGRDGEGRIRRFEGVGGTPMPCETMRLAVRREQSVGWWQNHRSESASEWRRLGLDNRARAMQIGGVGWSRRMRLVGSGILATVINKTSS